MRSEIRHIFVLETLPASTSLLILIPGLVMLSGGERSIASGIATAEKSVPNPIRLLQLLLCISILTPLQVLGRTK